MLNVVEHIGMKPGSILFEATANLWNNGREYQSPVTTPASLNAVQLIC